MKKKLSFAKLKNYVPRGNTQFSSLYNCLHECILFGFCGKKYWEKNFNIFYN